MDEKGYADVSPIIPDISIALLPEYRKKGPETRMLEV